MKVLLVEDKINEANNLLESFKQSKIECWTKSSALGALELLESMKFDIIVTALHLPHLNGETFAQIAKHKYQVPVIVTANNYLLCDANNFDAFILEPYDFSELLELINMLAKPKKLSRPAEMF